MVDLVEAVQEAVDRRKAAMILRHHPVLAQYVTEDYRLQEGLEFESRHTTTVFSTLGPIRMGMYQIEPVAWCIRTAGARIGLKDWVYIGRIAMPTGDRDSEWMGLAAKLCKEIDQC